MEKRKKQYSVEERRVAKQKAVLALSKDPGHERKIYMQRQRTAYSKIYPLITAYMKKMHSMRLRQKLRLQHGPASIKRRNVEGFDAYGEYLKSHF